MIKSFGYTKCTSCRKTNARLAESGVEHRFRDFFKDRFTKQELEQLLDRIEKKPSDVLSRRSKVFKSDTARIEGMSESELLQEMVNEPTLLRRPIVVDETGAIIGHHDGQLSVMIDRSR